MGGGGGGGNCTLWNVWNFTNCCIACRAFCGTRHTHKHSVFPAWCLQLSKVKQNAKMVLVQLAFPIIAHQICKSQSEVRLHTGCSVHFHTIPFTRPSYSIFSRVWFRDYTFPVLLFLCHMYQSHPQILSKSSSYNQPVIPLTPIKKQINKQNWEKQTNKQKKAKTKHLSASHLALTPY